MCYEETLFRRWARKRAQQREEPRTVVERETPATQPKQPAPAAASGEKKAKEIDRELEPV